MVSESNINEDVYAAGDYNVDSSLSSLFKEIGNTLQDVAKQGISVVGETVKTTLAKQIMNSPEGKAQISAYKMQTVMSYLPWVALAVVAYIVGAKFLKG